MTERKQMMEAGGWKALRRFDNDNIVLYQTEGVNNGFHLGGESAHPVAGDERMVKIRRGVFDQGLFGEGSCGKNINGKTFAGHGPQRGDDFEGFLLIKAIVDDYPRREAENLVGERDVLFGFDEFAAHGLNLTYRI